MLHSGDLVKIELILVVEQETPPLYLWKAPNRLIERFIPFFLNHAFIKALRHTQRPSVKGFVPYLVKLPVPLVPLEKIPVPALHLPKLHKELFRHFQLVGFALPVLKADKIFHHSIGVAFPSERVNPVHKSHLSFLLLKKWARGF